MFVRLEFTDEAAEILVEREKIVKMNTLRKMDRKRIDATCQALRRPGGGDDGVAVAALAQHNLLLASALADIWHRTSRTKGPDDIKDDDVLEAAGVQLALEEKWKNDDAVFTAVTDAELNKDFSSIREKFINRCSTVRGCLAVPVDYCLRDNVFPKKEEDDDENEYLTVDAQMIMRCPFILPAHYTEDKEEIAAL